MPDIKELSKRVVAFLNQESIIKNSSLVLYTLMMYYYYKKKELGKTRGVMMAVCLVLILRTLYPS